MGVLSDQNRRNTHETNVAYRQDEVREDIAGELLVSKVRLAKYRADAVLNH